MSDNITYILPKYTKALKVCFDDSPCLITESETVNYIIKNAAWFRWYVCDEIQLVHRGENGWKEYFNNGIFSGIIIDADIYHRFLNCKCKLVELSNLVWRS